jgi:hypothetical protein
MSFEKSWRGWVLACAATALLTGCGSRGAAVPPKNSGEADATEPFPIGTPYQVIVKKLGKPPVGDGLLAIPRADLGRGGDFTGHPSCTRSGMWLLKHKTVKVEVAFVWFFDDDDRVCHAPTFVAEAEVP